MTVRIPEDLLFDMVNLLTRPQKFNPGRGQCVLSMEARDRVLQRLLPIRRSVVFDGRDGSCLPGPADTL